MSDFTSTKWQFLIPGQPGSRESGDLGVSLRSNRTVRLVEAGSYASKRDNKA